MIKAKTKIPCIICGSENNGVYCHTRSERVRWLRTPISICKDCGFVFVNPRWTREEYDRIMDEWYPNKFDTDPNQKLALSNTDNEDVRFYKWRLMDKRILEYYPKGVKKLLDVGAGQGWCIEYLNRKFPDMEACAVERWPDCQKNIEERYNGKIIGTDIDGDWDPAFEGQFDLIVFRHTLEHIMDPKPVLERLRRYLSDDGYAYLVVPGIMEAKRNLLHDYFRPIHVSYFCEDTLISLAGQAGLEPFLVKEKGQGEVWGLFKKGEVKTVKPDVYQKTLDVIEPIRKREIFKSFRVSLMVQLVHLLKSIGIFDSLSALKRTLLPGVKKL